ncbi:MAG TPA: type II toxin-antitoxin system HicB family antitoxin [Ktedonobacterales bacterium]
MLTTYIEEAMRQATYERIEDGSVFGSIPGFAGLWANADTEEECRRELRDALEGWILLHVADHTPLPTVNGVTLDIGTPI